MPTDGILPEIGVAQAEPPGERRADRLLRDHRPRALDGRGSRVARRQRLSRPSTAACCRPATSIFCRVSVASAFLSWASPLARSACSTELSMLIRRSPALTSPPDSKWMAEMTPAACGAIDDPLIGAQRPDRRQLRRPFLHLRRLDRHRRRLRREGRGHEALDHGRLDDKLEIGEARRSAQRGRPASRRRRPAGEPRAAIARMASSAANTAAATTKASGETWQMRQSRPSPRGERQRATAQKQQQPVRHASHCSSRFDRTAALRSAGACL